MQTISISKKTNKLIMQLAHEIKDASESFTKKQWLILILKIISLAGHDTFVTKAKSVKTLSKQLNKKIRTYKANPKRAFKRDALSAKKAISEFPNNIKSRVMQFQALPKEKQCESAIVSTIGLVIFFASAGGFDFEGGLPDQDLKFGIGKHRHILSHSIILGFGAEFTMRFVILFLSAIYFRLPNPHHEIWDKIHEFIQKTKNIGIAAMWMGIGAHLLKDANLFAARIKPYVGIPGSHGMTFHKNLFATNAAIAEIIGIKSIKK